MIIKKGCNFESNFSDGNLYVLLRGEIDHHSAVSVRSSIDEKLYEFRPKNVIMDLSKIDFMDSSGLGLIMGRYALMQKLGGNFFVANPSERVLKIFERSGLLRIIKIVNIENKEEERQNENKD